jgi:hypothetical protein
LLFGRSGLTVGLLLAVFLPSAPCQVPEFFGVYAVVDGKLAPLIGGKGTFTPDKTSLQVYDYQKMSADTQDVLVLQGGQLRFEVFDAAVADRIAGIDLFKLPYGRNLVTRLDTLGQVGAALGQMSGGAGSGNQSQGTGSPLQKYVLAKTDMLKVELLQRPVPGQPQMILLVPAADLDPGIYCLFSIFSQGGQQGIGGQLFEWKGQGQRDCIDVAVTGGFGGPLEESESRQQRPYYLPKEKYVKCVGPETAAPALASGTSAGNAAVHPNVPGGAASATPCQDADACLARGVSALRAGSDQDAVRYWNTALRMGGTVSFPVCHAKGLHCERGTLSLDSREISFATSDGSKVFNVPLDNPGNVALAIRTDDVQASFNVRIDNRNNNFTFVPSGVQCAIDILVTCPSEGTAQQLAVSRYVAATVQRLARGTTKPQGQTAPPVPAASVPQDAAPEPATGILRNQDIIALAKAGVDSATILAKIASSRCQFDTSTEALRQLGEAGVGASVLNAMARAPKSTSQGRMAPPVPSASAPRDPAPESPTGILRNQDIIALTKAGVDSATILAKITSSRCQFDTSTEALRQLGEAGVGASVLNAMVRAPK